MQFFCDAVFFALQFFSHCSFFCVAVFVALQFFCVAVFCIAAFFALQFFGIAVFLRSLDFLGFLGEGWVWFDAGWGRVVVDV